MNLTIRTSNFNTAKEKMILELPLGKGKCMCLNCGFLVEQEANGRITSRHMHIDHVVVFDNGKNDILIVKLSQ